MKKYILIMLSLIMVFSLSSCKEEPTKEVVEEPIEEEIVEDVKVFDFEATVLEVSNSSLIVEPAEGSNEMKSSDRIIVSHRETNDFYAGYKVKIYYDGQIAESYPAQIVADKVEILDDSKIVYKYETYEKKELCNDTLIWLSMTEEQKALSDYYPVEFSLPVTEPIDVEKWGVSMEVLQATPTSLMAVINQSGGSEISELNTSDYYFIQEKVEDDYVDVAYINSEDEVMWNSMAYVLEKEGQMPLTIDWGWLYGELPAGEYRIGKEIMNFRDTQNYDIGIVYATFEIK